MNVMKNKVESVEMISNCCIYKSIFTLWILYTWISAFQEFLQNGS